MKDKLFDKIVKKDYNNDLERILSKKEFSLEVKNTILSMFYKIENGYNDYNIIKRDTFDKSEYVQNLINIIDKNCDKIEFLNSNSNKKEKIDKDEKTIICKPIEIDLLYAISKMRKKGYNSRFY